jgi:hypothetical protein
MRNPTPLSPMPGRDSTVYLVLDDFGPFGRAWRETRDTLANRHTVLADLMSGQYERPLRIVAFNTAEGWARDVTAEMAQEAMAAAGRCGDDLPATVRDLLERTP